MSLPIKLPLLQPPANLCLIRLSALGDVSHTLPLLRTLQTVWPETSITWIIGSSEYALVSDISDVEFIPFDKKAGLKAYQQLRRQLQGRQFDLLLMLQMSLRASMLSLLINSPLRLGFDRQRAKDFQWLFSNQKIAYQPRQHVIDSFFGFSDALGITPDKRQLRWDIPIPAAAFANAQALRPAAGYFIISPCASKAYRNWLPERYRAVAEAIYHDYHLQPLLCGGPSETEQRMGEEIIRHCNAPILNLIGKTPLKTLLALLSEARFIISPDSGTAHLGSALGRPVIGLYACTNPERARPYLNAETTVNCYPEAMRQKWGTKAASRPWGSRVKEAFAMQLITTEAVLAMVAKIQNTEIITNSRSV
ncbi:MAG: glycosyltransferase family 9 protein [Gammaproteobacteria bacterium]|nr:glycosyltransferase family 9 protein [Gammaproteobacteria bacterium]